MFTLHLPCIFVQLINSHQQTHQNKFVADFFIKSFPEYAFRQLYCHYQGGSLEFVHRPMCFVSILVYVQTPKNPPDDGNIVHRPMCFVSTLVYVQIPKNPPDDGNIVVEMRIGENF
jgi:hypothetical protein